MDDDELDNHVLNWMRYDSEVGMYNFQIEAIAQGIPPVAWVHKTLGLPISAPSLTIDNPTLTRSPPKGRLSVVRR